MSVIFNRLQKNHRRLAPWAKRMATEAWRLYDRDIPEYPFLVDLYGDHVVIFDRTDPVLDAGKNQLPEVIEAVTKLFSLSPEKVVVKRRERQEGLKQYERLGESGRFFPVQEGPCRFRVNLWDYLDTGLFLDHRPLRHRMSKTAAGKKLLNLFCYTSSVSTAAAKAGAKTVNIDMSATYLDWSQENFRLNDLPVDQHAFIQADVLQWLENPDEHGLFDIIYLDPPTFSNSKRMRGDFEVERDQEFLVEHCLRRLAPDGVLYFSNNKRSFKLAEAISKMAIVRDWTEDSIPQDFHDRKIHRCYLLTKS